jgi:hypothetical protein
MTMKIIIAAVALALVATPALAQKSRHRAAAGCAPAQKHFSLLDTILSTGPAPQANGCAPAVYSGGHFIGQDPDPAVRSQLRRNPEMEGYYLSR